MTLIVFLLVLTFVIYKSFNDVDLSKQTILIAWGTKLGYSLIFYWVMVYYYGNGALYGDAKRFMTNAGYIYPMAFDYPFEYFKLLFGFADFNNPDLQPYFEPTKIYLGGNDYDFLNDNRLIIKINSIIYLFSKGNVLIHLLIHSFISYIGVLLIFKSFKSFVANKRWFWWMLVLLPSIAFWGGGITKSSILLLALGLLFYALKLLYSKSVFKGIIYFVFAVLMLIFNKPYVGLIVTLFSSLLFIGYLFKFQSKYIWITFSIVVFSFLMVIFDIIPMHFTERISFRQQDMINVGKGGVYFVSDSAVCYSDYKYVDRFETIDDTLLVVKQSMPSHYKPFGTKIFYPFELKADTTKYQLYISVAPSNSYYEVTPIDNSSVQLLKNIPKAVFDVFIRPFPWDNGTSLKIIAFIQNIGLLVWLLFSVFNRRKPLTLIQKWLIYYLIISSLFLALIIGWTTPVFGAIVRYKMTIDLFMVIISFILLKPFKNETD